MVRQATSGTLQRTGANFGNVTHREAPRDCGVENITFENFRGPGAQCINVLAPSIGCRAVSCGLLRSDAGLRLTDMPAAPTLVTTDFALDGCWARDMFGAVVTIDGRANGATGTPISGVLIRNLDAARTTGHLIVRHALGVRIEGGWLMSPAVGAATYGLDALNVPGLAVIGLKLDGLARGARLQDSTGARLVLYPLGLTQGASGAYNGLWENVSGNAGSIVLDGFTATTGGGTVTNPLNAHLDAAGFWISGYADRTDPLTLPYTLLATDRGRIKVYPPGGGSGTLTVPDIGDGAVEVVNDSTAAITVVLSGGLTAANGHGSTITAGQSALIRVFSSGATRKAKCSAG
jgi:hypothetical protein